MRLLLAMLARRHRELYLDAILDVVRRSFDGVEVRYDEGEGIKDFARARNQLVRSGERQGFDWILMLDADECMFPDDIGHLRALMEETEQGFIALPRINLGKDPEHFVPMFYPDYQGRAFRLNAGYHYRHAVHEKVHRRLGVRSEINSGNCLISGATPIYHYGLLDNPRAVVLRSLNYDRIARGLPILSRLTDEEYEVNAERFLWPLEDQHLQSLDLPHPLAEDAPPDYASGWASFYLRRSTPAEEALVLSEHATLLQQVEASRGPVIEVGTGSGILSRQLASRGMDVTSVDADERVVRRAAETGNRVGVAVERVDAFGLESRFGRQRFRAAFSEGLFQFFDDESAQRALDQQLKIADRVLLSVPVGAPRWPEGAFGGEHYRSVEQWQALLGPMGRVQVSAYGRRYLPLRSGLLALARRRLNERDRHLLFEVTPG